MSGIDFRITVEKCIDSDEYVWSILDDYNGVRADGYSATEADAWVDARKCRHEEIQWLSSSDR
jgi:hypothetical protein